MMLLASCTGFMDRVIDMEIPAHSSRIVLNSTCQHGDEGIRLRITRSVGLRDSTSITETLKDPAIDLTVNGNLVPAFSLDTSSTFFFAHYPLRSGDHLEVEVTSEGLETVKSRSTIPRAAELVSARFGSVNYGFGGQAQREVFFRIRDIPAEYNYYQIKFVQERDGKPFRSIHIDTLIPWLAPLYPFGLCFDDTPFRDSEMELQIMVSENIYSRNQEDVENYLVLETIEKSYFDYVTTFYYHQYNQQPGLFGGEPVPMVTNVENGFGIFAASASNRKRIER